MTIPVSKDYQLDQQVGFILRIVSQRSSEIFSNEMPSELTPTRFAAMMKLYEMGALSQNKLGRYTAMDVATIKGVVDRLNKIDLVDIRNDPNDGRKYLVDLSTRGRELINTAIASAFRVSEKTLEPLTKSESKMLMSLLKKIC